MLESVFFTSNILFPKLLLNLEYSFFIPSSSAMQGINFLHISADYLWIFKTLSKPISNYLVYHFQNRYNLIYVNTFPCQKAGSSSPPFSWNKAIHVGAGLQNAKPFTLCRVTELQILQEREEKGLGVWFEANSTTHGKREGSGRLHKLETLLFNFTACVTTSFITFWP